MLVCQAAFGHDDITNDGILGIQQNHRKDFVPEIPQSRMEMLKKSALEVTRNPVESGADMARLPSSMAALSCAAFAGPTPGIVQISSSPQCTSPEYSPQPFKDFHGNIHR